MLYLFPALRPSFIMGPKTSEYDTDESLKLPPPLVTISQFGESEDEEKNDVVSRTLELPIAVKNIRPQGGTLANNVT